MRIVFCGNCQMEALDRCYGVMVAPHTGDETRYVRYRLVDQPAARRAAAQADVVVEQKWPTQDVPRLPDVPAHARRIFVPSVGTPFLWPFIGVPHIEGRKYGNHNPFTGEYSDTWLLRQLKAGRDRTEIETEYLALDVARHARLDRRLEMSLDIQHALDRATGQDYAGIIETHFRTERLFRTAYHAEGRIMRHMLCRLLDELGAPEAVCESVRLYLKSGMFHPREMPVHPGIAAHFGLSWAGEATYYRFTSETMLSFRDWVRRFLHCESYPIVWQAVDAVRLSQAGAEDMLVQAEALLPDSPLVVHSRAIVTMRAGGHKAALPVLEELAQRYAGLPFIDGHLADCHLALGDRDAAEAALRREIDRSGHVRNLYVRLADLLRRKGRSDEAAGYQRIAAALGKKSG